MPSHYRSPYGYSYFNPTGKEQAALTIGSLLAGALAASSGQSKGDAIRKGLAGTMAGYGSGYKNYQDLMGDAFTRDIQTKGYGQRIKEYEDSMGLDREKFAEEKRQYEETEKPERLARTNYYNEREPQKKEFNTPGDLDTFLASKAGRFGLDYSSQTDRMKMLQLFGNQSTGLSRQYNQWKPSLAPSIYNVIPGYQTPEGQPKTYNVRTGLPSEGKPLQKTPSEADVKFERDYTTADALLDELEASFEANKGGLPQDAIERVTEYPSRQIGKVFQTKAGAGLKNLESLRIAIMPKMIRALGEVGTLTDADIARVNQAIPAINDVESVRTKGFQQIRDLIKEVNSRGKRQENIIPGSSINKRPPLSAFESK